MRIKIPTPDEEEDPYINKLNSIFVEKYPNWKSWSVEEINVCLDNFVAQFNAKLSEGRRYLVFDTEEDYTFFCLCM